MNKTSKVMLIFACIFVTLTTILLGFQAFFEFASLGLLYGQEADLGKALGGVLIYLYSIIFGVAAIVSAVATLPFNIVLLKNIGKKWYSLAILIFTIAAIISAITLFFLLPIVSDAVASNSSSSMASSSSY